MFYFLVLAVISLIFLGCKAKEQIPAVPAAPEEPEAPIEAVPPENIPIPPENISLEEEEASVTILIKGGKYEPATLTIAPGTTVTWINKDNRAYKINEKRKLLIGPRMGPEESFTFTFTNPGTYYIFDSIQPSIQGKIIVAGNEVTGMSVIPVIEKVDSVIPFLVIILGLIPIILIINKKKKR